MLRLIIPRIHGRTKGKRSATYIHLSYNFSSIVTRCIGEEGGGKSFDAGSDPTEWNGRLNYRRTVNRERNKEEDWVPGVLSSEHSRNFFFRTRVCVRAGQRPGPNNLVLLIQPRNPIRSFW